MFIAQELFFQMRIVIFYRIFKFMNFYVCIGVSVLCCENHKCCNNLDTFFRFPSDI